MAAIQAIIANPTGANVTVNAKVAVARTVTKLALDDATIADWPGWLNAGCSIGPYTLSANVTQNRRRQGGYLLGRLQGLWP
jgi:hypothetical protein